MVWLLNNPAPALYTCKIKTAHHQFQLLSVFFLQTACFLYEMST